MLTWVVLIPSTVHAQASIAGVVRDTSGAVLPGVTVEAASPVLIEKVRTAVTDGNGVYRITELRPGTYTVTFTIAGFNVVKREGIQLTGSFTASVEAEMRVGALEETITVTGEAPIVDVQTTTRQRVVDQEVISTLPTGRNMFNLGVLIPGISLSTGGLANQDVGGSLGPETRALAAHGGRTEDQRFMMNGVSLSSMIGGGWGGGAIPNATGVQEIVFDTASVSADLATGGVRINFIAREGGNQYHGTLFGSFANSAMQATNIDESLLERNPLLRNAGGIDKNWDFNPGFGGPLKRDRVWFYLSGRSQGAFFEAPGMFFNRNANDPTKWTYEPDTSQPAAVEKSWLDAQLRLTWQAAERHKLGLTYTQQDFCACHDAINATTAPEAATDRRFPTQRVVLLDWTSPLTSRVLLEASGIHRVERWGNMHLQTKGFTLAPEMIGVNEQGGAIPGLNYRGRVGQYNNSWNDNFHYRFNVSYITGSHAFKVGMNNALGYHENQSYVVNPLSYRFNNGVPNQITMRALPHTVKNHVDTDLGLFAQDRWTINRATISLGIRYDHFASTFPEQELGPTAFTPARNLTFARKANLSYHDLTPKSQVAYDLFGNGRTALKASLNKYLQGLGTTGALVGGPNPIAVLSTQASRNWNDRAGLGINGDYVPQCDLLNPAANGECGPLSPSTFGSVLPGSTYDPELLTGWGKRFYNWEFSAGVQHEILPRVSVDVSYFRRWYGNFVATDNRSVGAADFDQFSVTAPSDPRLPNGGGYAISGFKNISEAKFSARPDDFVTHAKNFGDQIDRWNGVDVGVNARLANGLYVQGGTSTGRTVADNCEILAQLPEMSVTGLPYCHEVQNWLTQIKGAASYTIPRIDVSLAATFQHLPGPTFTANWAAPNALVAPSLGRNLAGRAQVVTVNLVPPGTMYGDPLNQLDLRFAKIVRFGATRTTFNFDIYNATNSNTILTLNSGFAPQAGGGNVWQRPNSILQARFFKIGAQFDF
ncbi:MAG: carboxypeptidase regulatory-like domain-containing protein [Acidobacteria bacterium]|nr:carboxypeptidase regulatory-like domain-containing protein [Acidobacteriota bacterium]